MSPASRQAPGRRGAVLAAAALALLVVAAFLAGCSPAGPMTARRAPAVPPTPTPSAPASGSPTPFAVPAGWKAVSSLGLQFAVPRDWPVQGALGCGRVPPFVVLRGGGVARACGHVDAPTQTVVSVGRTAEAPGTTRLPDGRWRIRAARTGSPAMLTATGPDAALLTKVVATLEQVDVDRAGCPTRQPPRPGWDRPAAGHPLAIGDVTGVSVCVYDRGAGWRLAASAVLDAPERHELVEAIARARAGPVPDRTRGCAAGLGEDHAVLVLLRTGAATAHLAVHYDGCTNRYVAGEHGVSQVTARQLEAIHAPLHLGYGFSGDLPRE